MLSSTTTLPAALEKYVEASKKTFAAPVTAEYAYALAYAGLGDAALYTIDRALLAEPLNPEVRFYLSEIFNAFGLEDASAELGAPVPAWLKTPLKLPSLELAVPVGDFDTASAAINQLMDQNRYAQSAVMLARLCKKLPDNAQCPAGYALVLAKLGAYKAAIVEARKNLALTQTPERKAIAAAYIADLETRPALKYATSPDKPLKGRYLAFMGGSLNHADGQTTYTFSSRLGKFLSERVDVSANAALNSGNAISSYNGPTLGVAARYNEPLGFAPLSGTLAAKIERVPAPAKNLTFLVSPGFSYFLRDSSFDLFWDIALSGPYGGSVTMSLGYTMYFGGGK